jgi:ribosomal protein S18 acetylase RimI-like enzyme
MWPTTARTNVAAIALRLRDRAGSLGSDLTTTVCTHAKLIGHREVGMEIWLRDVKISQSQAAEALRCPEVCHAWGTRRDVVLMAADDDLYRRGNATLLASWEAYARCARDAELRRLPGVSAAVFPHGPERGVYNNALLEHADAIEAMEGVYAAAGVDRFAAWVHERDERLAGELKRRGYLLDTTTRVMGMALDGIALPRPDPDLATLPWAQYLNTFGLPAGLLGDGDRSGFHVLVARVGGEPVSTVLAFDHDGDCGIYNVATLGHARRRGLGTALTALALHDAVARGCRTASVQSTPMAERVYAAAGFRDLGRSLEFVPPSPGVDGGHG